MPQKFFLRKFEFLVFDSVYVPSEDSWLLAQALKISRGSTVLDMGCGTGIQGLNAIMQGASFVCFADKNPAAVENAKKNFELAKKYGLCQSTREPTAKAVGLRITDSSSAAPPMPKGICFRKPHALSENAEAEFVATDLFSGVNKKFDFVLFNPPYVPANEKKFLDLDGGKKGREVLDKFLASVAGFLNPRGNFFFLQSSLNSVPATKKILKEKGFKGRIVARQKLFFEELLVFEAWQ